MIARWGPVVILVLLALGSAWILSQLSRQRDASTATAPHVPDFYMENFSTTTMDELGKPKRTLSADHMAHFPDTDTNELENPYMILFDPARPPWHVRSERGWVSPDSDVMLLLGNVHIWRNNEVGERVLDLTTRDLRVLPDSQYGETDKPVVIRTPSSESRGTGMRAFLDQRRIELLSRVRTVYEKKAQ